VFGEDVLSRRTDEGQLTVGPVDADYVVGPGDELLITAWGDIDVEYRLTVNRDGTIMVPLVGSTVVQGRTAGELTEYLRRRFQRVYPGLRPGGPSQLEVSLGRLRAMTVFVLGHVNRPGSFTVQSLASVMDVLSAAGGAIWRGSLRNVQVIRAGQTDTLDLYSFLLNGNLPKSVRLHHGDVVVIPPAERQVGIRGQVVRPAVYELRKDDTLDSLIAIAGRLTPFASNQDIQIERIVNREKILMLRASLDEADTLKLLDGDLVTILPVISRLYRTFTVTGEVWRPGQFPWQPGMRLADALASANGIRPDAFLGRIDVTRELANMRKTVLSVEVQGGTAISPSQNIEIMEFDSISVAPLEMEDPLYSVRVSGLVARPGKYPLRVGMRLKDLLFAAGGFLEPAQRDTVVLARWREGSSVSYRLSQELRVPVDTLWTRTQDDVMLKADDHVFVRRRREWLESETVSVLGEVEYPGEYRLLSKAQRITDIVRQSGGLRPTAFVDGAELRRVGSQIPRVAIDLEAAFRKPNSSNNAVLMDGDVLYIPPTPHTVTVLGVVGLQAQIIFVEGKKADYYVEQAGGYAERADRRRTIIVSMNGKAERAHRRFAFDPKVTRGSVIQVPAEEPTPKTAWGETIRDITTYLGALATTVLLITQVMK
jgi:protein involved in polysaccharide export with SLBB domain